MRDAGRFVCALGSVALAVLCAVKLHAAEYEANEIPPPSQRAEQFLDTERENSNPQAKHYHPQSEELRDRPREESFWANVAANPAATLSVFGAIVAALVTITTFVFNYRATIRNQRDTQFYEALKRFGDQSSSIMRSSAAGLLGQMAGWRTGFRHPYYATVLDQLSLGLILEEDVFVREANGRAIQRLITPNAAAVIASLRDSNIRLQGDLIHILAKRAALRQESREGLPWESLAAASGYKVAWLQALTTRHDVAFNEALMTLSVQCKQVPETARQELIHECDEQLVKKALILRENCLLLQSIASQVLLKASDVTKRTRKGFVTSYKQPRRRHSQTLALMGTFLPRINLSYMFIRRAYFEYAMLPEASFKGSIVADTTFHAAQLHKANFSETHLHSSRVRPFPGLWGGSYMDYPTSFVIADIQDADFRGAAFDNVMLSAANMAGAKLYGASIADEKTWWDEVNWWEADFSRGNISTFDLDSDMNRTRASLALLHKKYGSALTEQESRIHPSVLEHRATET
jgi:uncharacterized protein YjbI with pentapeptide repeats